MNLWNLSLTVREVAMDFSLLSLFLVLGTVFRRYGSFFQKYLMPNNIIAGFFGLLVGPQILGLTNLNSDRLEVYIYHLLALTFVAVGLRQEKTSWGKGPVSFSITMLSCYIVQAVIGLLVAFAFIYTIKPDLFPAIGLLVPLGFGMGPGVASTMGNNWESFGFIGGGNIGLTFAAIGYLIAIFAGLALIRRGIKNKETKLINGLDSITNDVRTGVIKEGKPKVAGFLTLSQEAIEPLAFQLGLIGIVYLITFYLVLGLTTLMENAGLGGFVATVWSFHFVVGLLVAISVRKVMDLTKKSYLIDKGLMNRIAGVCVDYLVVGAICAISLPIIWKLWPPILIISILAGIGTYMIIRFTSTRAFDDYYFERFISLFGEMTGTLNSGLVLLRVTDPGYRTSVVEDLVYASGIALVLGFPLLILLNVPMNFFNNSLIGYWITLGLIIVYLIVLWVFWRLIGFIKFKKATGA